MPSREMHVCIETSGQNWVGNALISSVLFLLFLLSNACILCSTPDVVRVHFLTCREQGLRYTE